MNKSQKKFVKNMLAITYNIVDITIAFVKIGGQVCVSNVYKHIYWNRCPWTPVVPPFCPFMVITISGR